MPWSFMVTGRRAEKTYHFQRRAVAALSLFKANGHNHDWLAKEDCGRDVPDQ